MAGLTKGLEIVYVETEGIFFAGEWPDMVNVTSWLDYAVCFAMLTEIEVTL